MYPLSPDLIDFLVSPPARIALEHLKESDLRDAEILDRLTELRKRFPQDRAAALIDQARLRKKAAAKFPNAERMLFDDEALQQASSRAVAAYHAQHFAGYRRVGDLGCGIGADMLALAEVIPEVIAIEIDPVRARLAELNADACGLAHRVQVLRADWTTLDLDIEAAFADPARRVDGHRVFRLEDIIPPIAAILTLQTHTSNLAVKVAPGIDHADIPPQAEAEFISEQGEMKEALLRFGALRTGAQTQATLLPGRHQLNSQAAVTDITERKPGAFLYEPDPAILRAGLVRHLATQLGADQLDADIAYLTSDVLTTTPFARGWQVIRHGRFHLKTLNHWLRELGAGSLVVKKRGSPIDPEEFRRRLKTTPGGPAMTVFLTHVQGQPWMIIGVPTQC
ncbi:MAG: class I SAM-dependent methyltransferase [Anaerolineae bacterium]|nr:class I SAM-dependent methyltransferase [Anaerolineae bacterium]